MTRKFSRFGHKLGLYCIFFIAHARNGHISTSGKKIWRHHRVGLDPDFLYGAKISAIRVHLRQIYDYLIYLHGFSGPVDLKWGFWGQNRGMGGVLLTPNEFVLHFGGSYVCANFGENRSRNATMRVFADRQIHWHTDRRKPILANVNVFSERELTFTFAICCRPSVCRLFVVCRL